MTGLLPMSVGLIDTVPSAPVQRSRRYQDPEKSRAQSECGCGEGAQGPCLESLLLAREPIQYDEWLNGLARHPARASLARGLIWSLERKGKSVSGLLTGRGLRDLENRKLQAAGHDVAISLWHPARVASEEVRAWRSHLRRTRVSQPFRQAFRETYGLSRCDLRTRTYTNRFAAQTLHQDELSAACAQLGWSYRHQGLWDSFNTPTRNFENWGLTAQLWVAPASGDSLGAASPLPPLITDQACFRDHDGERLPLELVPPVVFSEVMRDIDYLIRQSKVTAAPRVTAT